MSLNFGHFQSQSKLPLGVLIECCDQSGAFIFGWTSIIVEGNKNNHTTSNESECRPDQTSDCGVRALPLSVLNNYRRLTIGEGCGDSTIGSFFILVGNQDAHKALNSLNFDTTPQLTKDLAAIERLKNIISLGFLDHFIQIF